MRDSAGPVPFTAHVALLRSFLARRDQIVERIQGLLNAQQAPLHYLQDRGLLARQFEDCFFALPASTREQLGLRGQLQQVHWSEGFRPRVMPGIPNDMFDPADMMARAFTQWQHTRWPGRNGRMRFAQTLFNLYIVRYIALLNMRLWDAGASNASAQLVQVQDVLDALWRSAPTDQPRLVRDARWLVPVAQSPTTDDLAPYFCVAEKIATSFSESDRIEIHKAAVVMAGGHLRSQLRHFTMQGKALHDHDLLLSTRRSNALDCAMTVQGLVPLLRAYANAIDAGDQSDRLMLADAICQGISPDPELFVNRLDLLAAYSMIEQLFATQDCGGAARLTATGQRHIALLQDYAGLVTRLRDALGSDCAQFRPVSGTYSPYGVMYGFSSNLLEHMTMKALQPEAETRFSLEDVFAAGGDDKLAWVSGWRKLPHMSQEIQKLYEYPQQFAEVIHGRIMAALQCAGGMPPATGRLRIASEGAAATAEGAAPELPSQYVFSTDQRQVAMGRAQPCELSRLLAERNEGEFLVSYQVAGEWTAISKDIFTDVLGEGRSARLVVPAEATGVLELLYPHLIG